MHERLTRCERGFTLVEVLLAGLILLVAVSGVLAVFPQAYGSVRNAERVSVLSQLAAGKLDELRRLPYDDPDLALGVHPTQATDSSGARYYSVPGSPETYSLRWIVETGPLDGAGAAEPRMKRVSIQATYRVRYLPFGAPPRPRTRLLTPQSDEVVFHTFVRE